MHLTEYRLQRHMSMLQLSRHSHISVSHISRIEQGERVPTILTLCMLAKALGVRPEELYTCVD